MKCSKCKIKDATTRVKRVVNGEYEEYMLCADCAHEMGFTNVFDMELPDMFGGLMKSIFGALPERTSATRCPLCGATFGDIQNTGKVGCAKCYEIFESQLLPSVRRIHSNTTHCGKTPEDVYEENAAEDVKPQTTQYTKEDMIKELKEKLEAAVKVQNFEKAAELRDKIRELEGSKDE